MIADENPRRLGGHGRGKLAKDLNTGFVGPIVTEERNRSQVSRTRFEEEEGRGGGGGGGFFHVCEHLLLLSSLVVHTRRIARSQ